MRVVCAMSGGVDSSTAAALMVEAGHDVVGMTLRLYDAPAYSAKGRGGTCCSPAEVDLARQVCAQLGIPHYVVDERDRFQRAVIDDFVKEYAEGRTPNPCTRCNEHVKFGPLLARARALGASRLVTGHYARIAGGALARAIDRTKDQSYFLFAMGRDNLSRVEFPLGTWTKRAVRDYAHARSLPNANSPDSHELCFVPDGDHASVAERRGAELGFSAERWQSGQAVDVEGRVLGHHPGIHRVTIGQRRGIGIATGEPRYVLRVLAKDNQVVLGTEADLARRSLVVADFRPMADLLEATWLNAHVQIRHRAAAQPARVYRVGETVQVEFEADVKAVAPGQAAVIYDDEERVLGGGWIQS